MMRDAPSMTGLRDRTAIVTGASRGIGAAIARRFAAEGARVAAVARTLTPSGGLPGSLEEVAASVRAAGGHCVAIQADLARPDALGHIVEETLDAFGGVDILVNNAAWARFPSLSDVPMRHVQLALQMNVLTPLQLAQLVLPYMRQAGQGWILNISSATADLPAHAPWDLTNRQTSYQHLGHPAVYGMSKAALDRMTAGLALELAETGIAVNALAPVGAVASEGARAVGGWDERDHLEPVEAMAEAALQLCHRPASELSGRIARSLPLLDELGITIRTLDGTGPFEGP